MIKEQKKQQKKSGPRELFQDTVDNIIRESNGTPLQYSCLENPMDGGVWWAALYGVAQNWTQLSDFTFTFHFHALEKEMATHSSVFAWRIPGTGSLGGCCLWVRTESDTTEATQQKQQRQEHWLVVKILREVSPHLRECQQLSFQSPHLCILRCLYHTPGLMEYTFGVLA